MKNYVKLLPLDYIKRTKQRQKLLKIKKNLTYVCSILVMAVIVCVFINIVCMIKLQKINNQTQDINQQVVGYSQYKKLNEDVNTIKNKINFIQSFDPQTLDTIATISACMPEGTWLESLNINSEAFTIVGCGNAYGDAAKTLQSFQTRSEFSDVICENTSENGTAVKFTISAVIN